MSENAKDWVINTLAKGTWTVKNCQGNVHSLVKDGLEFSFEHDDENVWLNVTNPKYQRPWQGCPFGAFQVLVGGQNQYLLAGQVRAGRIRLPILVSADITKDGSASVSFQLGGESLSELTQQTGDGSWNGEN